MKKRKRRSGGPSAPAEPSPGVYRPFRELRERLPEVPRKPAARPAGGGGSSAGGRPGVRGGGGVERESDGRAFESAMSDVRRIEGGPVPRRRSVPPPPIEDDAAIGGRFLAAFVDGDAPFDFADTDEYLEGSVHGLDPAIVQRLREGGFAVEGHVDLHGLDRHEAKRVLRDFLEQSGRAGRRCVLVVHGRGLGSKDGIAVLRERMREWLRRGGIGRRVLAFTSARPCDGGTGAVYVLLRDP